MASFIGEYQFAVALFGKQPVEVALTVDELLSHVGLCIRRKDLSVRMHFTALGRRYLSKRPAPELVYSFPKAQQEYDDTDLTIIQRLSTGSFESIRALSKELDIPLATLSRRIQRLEDTKIIGGYYYWVNANHFGVREYRLLISIANNHKAIRKGLVALCERIPQIVFLINCIGAWECEIGCDVSSYRDLLRIIDEIYKVDPKNVVDVRVLEVISHLKTA
jgi:DNA-binding Lrp family transcriptional regulator